MFQFRCSRRFAANVLALCAALPSFAQAQAFPTKPVRLIVGFPPGGSSDVVGRLIAEGATEALGQSVVIENVPGAGGSIGTARASKSPADDDTLVLCTIGTCAINPVSTPMWAMICNAT